ncbi:MAG: hypothetical protein EOP04_22620 [Proteobacteria bacterium]|nr:MAG: hypothetical protein EOP04_22620 [Pseudomonadota bacterium]
MIDHYHDIYECIYCKALVHQVQESTLHIQSDQEPLQDALKFLVGEQYPSVNIIDRNFCAKDYALFVGRINLVVLTPTQKIFPVNSGFGKWKAAGEEIEILQDVKNLRTSGLTKGTPHKFRTEKDGFYTLTFDQAFTFIAEDI